MKLFKRILMPHWPSIYGFALALIAANLVGRFIAVRIYDEADAATQVFDVVATTTYLSMIGVAMIAGIWWGVRRRRQEIVPELLPVFVVTTLFAVLVNPLLAGDEFPSLDGIFSQVLLYFVSLVVGAFVGYLIVMALGVDHYGRELKATKIAFERKANPARA
ncbi:hypothetical protein [Glycomyces tenuis]|uniref:hypothetical protein n=1 Tax=Glycomyces tenuis TaxID=58116 RepID=UPI0004184DE5|nr:hypothetical protein [Glycomyces tenuis]